MDNGQVTDGSDDRLQQFWELTQRYAHVGDFDAYMGKSWSQAVLPPAWSFGDSPELADELLALVVSGQKTATSALAAEYEAADEPLPKVGDLSILLDGSGEPQALIRDTAVAVVPFGEVTEQQARAEGEGDRDAWRAVHQRFWSDRGHEVTDDALVVWERFRVLYARP